jgi:hypothetical protein
MAAADLIVPIATALLGAGGAGAGGALINAVRHHGQDRAAALNDMTGAAERVVAMVEAAYERQLQALRDQLASAEARAAAAEARATAAQAEITQLKRDLATAGGAA